mgnify:CR=1 FL=1
MSDGLTVPFALAAGLTGVAAATGRYLVFIDDDEEPVAGWLASFVRVDALLELRKTANLVLGSKASINDYLVRAVAGADKALIAGVSVFDVYRGAGVPEGMKSVVCQLSSKLVISLKLLLTMKCNMLKFGSNYYMMESLQLMKI